MSNKRLTLELPSEQYEFLRKEASISGTTLSGLIRKLIDDHNKSLLEKSPADYENDPFFLRNGSFEGPGDLSVNHDDYLYGGKDGGKIPL